MTHDTRLRIAVFIDFDNIEIGVKNTLGGSFDVGVVLEALKERGEVVSKTAYSDWQRAGGYSRALTQHAIKMVQRNLTPGGDKNGADINLALDALEMAFTHPHINAFVIVGGDSDFISLVEKLKQYDKKVFVVGGKQFTSAIMQKNCHEFIAYENLVGGGHSNQRRQSGGREPQVERTTLDQVIPLVTRALKVLSEREVSPQLGLFKSTLLQLDSTFSERSYGAGSFRDFAEKLEKANVVKLHHGKSGMLVELIGGDQTFVHAPEADHGEGLVPAPQAAAPSRRGERGGGDRSGHDGRGRNGDNANVTPSPAPPSLAPVMATSTPEEGLVEFKRILTSANVRRWPMYLRNVKQILRQTSATFDERTYGFGSLVDLLRAAQKDGIVRVERDRQGVLRVFQGAAFGAISGTGNQVETVTDEINGNIALPPLPPLDGEADRDSWVAPEQPEAGPEPGNSIDAPIDPLSHAVTAEAIAAPKPRGRGRSPRPSAPGKPRGTSAPSTRGRRPRAPKKGA